MIDDQFADLGDEDGNPLERRPGLLLALVDRDYRFGVLGDYLLYRERDPQPLTGPRRGQVVGRPRLSEVKPVRNTLNDFISLAGDDVLAEDILRYAHRWGPLQVMANYTFVIETNETDLDEIENLPEDLPKVGQYYREPIYIWRVHARAARTILTVAQALDRGEPGSPDDVNFLTVWYRAALTNSFEESFDGHRAFELIIPDYAEMPRQEQIVETRIALENAMNDWLATMDISLHFEWHPHRAMQLHCASILGAIGLLLLQAISEGTIPTICHACGQFFAPKRKRDATKRAFCEKEECQRAKNRIHKQDERKRKAAKG